MPPSHHRQRTRASGARRALILALAASALALGACKHSGTIGVPAGLAADEARRLSVAVDLASEASRTKDPDAAALKYYQAVQNYRELPSAWNNLGVILMSQQRFLQAAEAFKTAADLSPSDPRPLYNTGLLWDRRGYIREARTFYARALERDNSYLPALRGAIRADSLLNEGSQETLEWVQRAVMLEEEPRWQKWLKQQKIRLDSLPSIQAAAQP